MAARQQQRGTGLKIQYEDLVPKSEWKDEPEATLLTIDLPGFAKEQIKVTYVHTSRMIRVTGERPLTDRRWTRFNEVFIVPQNCLVDKIHGSLKNNVLTITMPKETITKIANLSEASKTVEKLEEKKLLEEAKRKEEAEQFQKKLLEEREGLLRKLEEVKMKKKVEEDEEMKKKKFLEEEREGRIRKMQEEAEQKKKKLLEEREGLIRKMKEEAKAKEFAEEMRKLHEEVKAKEKPVEEVTLEKIQERKPVEEATQMLKPEDRKLPEVVYTKSGPKSRSKSRPEGVREVVKSAEEKLGNLVEKEKRMEKGIMEKIRGKEIKSEEKKLMVNVGVAALVIFALGAYVSYTFCSSSSSSSSSSAKPE